MESLLQIVVLLAFVRFACRATFFRSVWGIVAFALLVALLSFLSYPIVIEQSGDFYATLLRDATLVGNVAVLITLEAVVGMLFSIGLLRTLFKEDRKTRLSNLKYLPEILIAGAVLYAQQQVFYQFPGYDFRITAICTAFAFAILLGCVALLMRWALPEQSNRYELNFLINLFLLVVGILLNAGLSNYNTGNYTSNIGWKSAIVFLLIIAMFFLLGLVLYRVKLNLKKKNR